MRLEYQRDLDSIGRFEGVELPEFAVLTGVNGSGKTHLMGAIKDGAIKVDSIPIHEIGYYTYRDFLVPDSTTFNSQQIEAFRLSTWQHFTGKAGNPKLNWKSKLENIHNQSFIIQEENLPVDILESELPADVSIWDAYHKPKLVSERLSSCIQQYIQTIKQQIFGDCKLDCVSALNPIIYLRKDKGNEQDNRRR